MLAKARKGLAFILALMMVFCVFPMRVFAEDTSGESRKLPYEGDDLGFFKEDLTSAFRMLSPQENSSCELKGDKVVIHIVPSSTKKVYNALHWGYITEELTPDVEFNEDGTIDMELSAEEYCGYAHPVAPIKVKDGKTTSDQYYLAVPAAEKLQPASEDPTPEDPTGEEPAVVETAESVELTVINNTNMFKVVTASVETAKDGSRTLVLALNGTGYENLFKGTYEQAEANGEERTKWIAGKTNEDGKLEFRVPLEDGETYIPLVAISKSYLGKHDEDPENNTLERAFYPRQVELDLEAKTLVAGDYEHSEELTITNNVKMFTPKSAALRTVGGPNSNNYSVTLDFLYSNDKFSKAFIGRASEADSEGIEIVEAKDNLFSFKLKWIETAGNPSSVVNLMEEPFIVCFYSVNKETWYEREFTVDESGLTLTINEAPEEAPETVELTVINNTNMFKVVTASVETAKDGSRTLVLALNGTGYENLFKGTYEQAEANGEERTKWIAGKTNEDGKLEFRVPLEDGETYIPLVAISKSYLGKHDEDPENNTLERAFYPRQVELDLEAKTLVAGDYEHSEELTITNNVKMFTPKSAALRTVGGPNSNNYSVTLDFLYSNDKFSKAFIGRASEADSEGIEIVEAKDNLFSFKLKWIETAGNPSSVVNLMEEPFIVCFYSVNKETWYEREFTVDESGLTLTINEAPEEEETPAEHDVIKSINDKNDKNVIFKCEEVPEDIKLTKPVAAKVNDKVDDPEDLEILWQEDVVVSDDTEFPVKVVFKVDEDHKGMKIYIYHYDIEKKAWEVVGEGRGETVEVTMDRLSPVAMVAQKEEVPATGDTSMISLWRAMTVFSMAAASMLLFDRRRRSMM